MRDFLAECNNLGVTEDEFRSIWCIRCVRKDCIRSHQGKSKFEARVSTWEERLFTNVPRMPESDPRYPKLADQDFVEGESWGGKSTSVQVPANWEPAPESESEPEAAPPPDPAPLPSGFASRRVPHQSGRTLGDVQVVKPGAKIRLGGAKEPGEGGSNGVR